MLLCCVVCVLCCVSQVLADNQQYDYNGPRNVDDFVAFAGGSFRQNTVRLFDLIWRALMRRHRARRTSGLNELLAWLADC